MMEIKPTQTQETEKPTVKQGNQKGHQQHQQNKQPQPTAVETPHVDRPQVTPKAAVMEEMSQPVTLIKQHLETYASRITRATLASSVTAEYSALHGAFRGLMSLRGEEFKKGFNVFIDTIQRAKAGKDNLNKDAFKDTHVCARMDLFRNPVEGRAYLAFITLAISYSTYSDKQNFGKNKNIGRLTQHIADAQLRSLLEEAFNA